MSGADTTAIARLAAWLNGLRAEEISRAAVERAKLLLLDTLGCGLAAHDDATARAALATLDGLGGAPQCTVLGHARKMSAPNAVLANGTLVRVLDLNDYVVGAHPQSGARGGHPSDNIPVVLAAAELARSSGQDLLAAIVLAYELYGRGKALMAADSSWDGISVTGLVAPAAAGWLLRLPPERLAAAIGLGTARAATPVAVRDGQISAAKSIANALIAQDGMQATLLASRGVTGPLDVLEAERGLQAVFPRGPAGDILAAPLSDDGFIFDTAIKAYPCFAGGQSAVAAALALNAGLGGDVARLNSIHVALADLPVVRRWLADPGRVAPQSREAADHSLHFLIAVALTDGAFGLRQFDGARWNDPNVRALMARLDMTTDAALTRRAGGIYPCALRATGSDGRTHDVEVLQPPGFAQDARELGAAVLEKFARLTKDHLTTERRDRIVAAVTGLDRAASCADLMRPLAPDAATIRV